MEHRPSKLLLPTKIEPTISLPLPSPPKILEKSYTTLLETPSPPRSHEVQSATNYALLRKSQSLELPYEVNPAVMNIIKKEERTNEEAWSLYQYLKEYMFFNLFINMTNEMYQKECLIHVFKKFQYAQYPAGHVLFEEGDHSNGKMYVVLSGSVLVMLKRRGSLIEAVNELPRKSEHQSPRKDSRRHSFKKSIMEESHENFGLSPIMSSKDVNLERRDSLKKPSKMLRRMDTYHISAPMSTLGKQAKLQEAENTEDAELISPTSLFNNGRKKKEFDVTKSEIYKHSEVVTTIEIGGYFGERALESTQKRSASIVVNKDCELLVLTKEEFLLIKKTFNTKTRDLVDFVIRSVPGIELRHGNLLLDSFLHLFEEKTLNYKNHLIVEGASDENFYLIYSGSCEVYRTISIEEPSTLPVSFSKIKPFFSKGRKIKEKIPLSLIRDGSLVGEEVLFMPEKPHYSYSVQVTSDVCKVFCINKAKFMEKFNQNICEQIEQIYLDKKDRKDQILEEQIAKRGLELDDANIDTLFLNCKRKPVQSYTVETPKLNRGPAYYNSYKRIGPVPESISTRNYSINIDGIKQKEDGLLSSSTSQTGRNFSMKGSLQLGEKPKFEIANLTEMFGLDSKESEARARRANLLKSKEDHFSSYQKNHQKAKTKPKLVLIDTLPSITKNKIHTNTLQHSAHLTNAVNIDDLPKLIEKNFSPYKSALPQLKTPGMSELETSKGTYAMSSKDQSPRLEDDNGSALPSLGSKLPTTGRSSQEPQKYYFHKSVSTKRLKNREVYSERVDLTTETTGSQDCYSLQDEYPNYTQFLLDNLKKKIGSGKHIDPVQLLKEKRTQKYVERLLTIEDKTHQKSSLQKSSKTLPAYSLTMKSENSRGKYDDASLRQNRLLKNVTLEECFLSGFK